MKKILCLLAVLSIYIVTYGQNKECYAQLLIKAVDAATGIGIEDVTVYLPQLQKGGHTNVSGEVIIEGLCMGEFTLICKHLNHEEKKERIMINDLQIKKTIYLTCHTDTLHNITIKGARMHWEEVQVVNKIQANDLFMSQGLSIGKSLEKVNGVYNLSTGANISKPVIRGLHSNRVLILNNEVRQEGQQWGNEHAPEIDQFVAKSIEVIKGAQTIQYGSDIIGGVILVKPNPLETLHGIQGEYNAGFMTNGRGISNSLLLEGKLKQWKGIAWRLQGTYKRAGNNRTPDYFLKNTGMKEMNYSASVGYFHKNLKLILFHSYFNSDIGIFAGSHIGNLTDLYNAFQADKPIDSSGFEYKIDLPYQHVVHQLSKAELNYALNKLGEIKLTYSFQKNVRKEYDRNIAALRPDGTYEPSLNFLLKTQQSDIQFAHKPYRMWNGFIGSNYFYQQNEYYGAYFIPNYQKNVSGIYIVEKWHKKSFSFEGGIRYDRNNFSIKKWENQMLINRAHQYEGLAATTAMRYQLPYITLHLNAGTTWRAPFVNELYSYGVHHSAASFEIGDSTLSSERSMQASFTIDINIKNKIAGEVTVYNNYMRNFINLQPVLPATLTIRGAFPTFRFSQTDANIFGVEYVFTKPIQKKLQVSMKGNILRAMNVMSKKGIYGMPPARFEADLEYSAYNKMDKSVRLSLAASYTLKQNNVDPADDYIPTPPAYFLLHSDILAEWKIKKQPIKFNLSINNLLNIKYRDYLDRNRYFANEPGRNIAVRCSVPFQILKNNKNN